MLCEDAIGVIRRDPHGEEMKLLPEFSDYLKPLTNSLEGRYLGRRPSRPSRTFR